MDPVEDFLNVEAGTLVSREVDLDGVYCSYGYDTHVAASGDIPPGWPEIGVFTVEGIKGT